MKRKNKLLYIGMIFKNMFLKKFYLVLDVILFIFSAFFIIFPVFTTKGNNIKTQIYYLKLNEYLMIFILS